MTGLVVWPDVRHGFCEVRDRDVVVGSAVDCDFFQLLSVKQWFDCIAATNLAMEFYMTPYNYALPPSEASAASSTAGEHTHDNVDDNDGGDNGIYSDVENEDYINVVNQKHKDLLSDAMALEGLDFVETATTSSSSNNNSNNSNDKGKAGESTKDLPPLTWYTNTLKDAETKKRASEEEGNEGYQKKPKLESTK